MMEQHSILVKWNSHLVLVMVGTVMAFLFRETSETEIICRNSTEDLYARNHTPRFIGPFRDIREKLDYNFHKIFNEDRQMYQDEIMQTVLRDDTGCTPQHPWLVLTAGPMGAGKTHSLRWMHENGHFPLSNFVTVDPDHVRHTLHDFERYLKHCPEKAGHLTRKEVGMITEIITKAALLRGQNVLVDGSLRDANWYMEYIRTLRELVPNLRVAILHITAKSDDILARASQRAQETGRIVPEELLMKTIDIVPQSVKALGTEVDVVVDLDNSGSGDIEILTEDLDWPSFRALWTQECLR